MITAMKTQNNNIDFLLRKYYDGETTFEEERLIKQFYKSNAKAEFEPDSAILSYFKDEKENEVLGDEFDQKVLDEIIEKNQNNQRTKNNQFKIKIYHFAYKYKTYLSAAAVVLLFSVLSMWHYRSAQTSKALVITNQNFEENKQVAVAETKKALKLISVEMEKASKKLKALDDIDKYIDKQDESYIIEK